MMEEEGREGEEKRNMGSGRTSSRTWRSMGSPGAGELGGGEGRGGKGRQGEWAGGWANESVFTPVSHPVSTSRETVWREYSVYTVYRSLRQPLMRPS